MLRGNPGLSRRAVSRRVCEWLGWRGVNGKLKEVSCRKALLKLPRDGHILLPAAEGRCFPRARREPPVDQGSRGPELCCALEELGEITIVPVSSRYSQASRTWNALRGAAETADSAQGGEAVQGANTGTDEPDPRD